MNYSQFQKPQRYIGNELNVIKKTHWQKIKICLAYPDIYEIGMSNLGLHILYGMLNSFSTVVCERTFMPGEDYFKFLDKKKKPLLSLETKTPLSHFDIIAFNLSHELNSTNVLHMLKLGKIPLFAHERKETIVIGGGIPNPEPYTEFIDLFYIGEFEEKAPDFVNILNCYKDKESRLRAFSEIEGFYVPKFYNIEIESNKYIINKKYSYAHDKIKRIYVKDLNKSYFPLKWLTPYIQIIHDRVPIEIARGCPHQCTFCQARAVYAPYRQKRKDVILNQLKTVYQNTGYENFSFLSLSASNHSQIEEIIDQGFNFCQERKIGLSLPSLRINDILSKLYTKLIPLKKTSLTVAIEAARPCLREKINKRIDTNQLFEAAHILKSLKIKHLKIYFMFGFPQETDEDLIAIGEFVNKLYFQTKININLSINIFCPKPFSLWENVPMEKEEQIEKKRALLIQTLPRRRNINLSMSSTKHSLIETIISRADRSFHKVILNAYTKGDIFSGHKENFKYNIWEEAMKEEQFDYRRLLEAKTENFPWSFIK